MDDDDVRRAMPIAIAPEKPLDTLNIHSSMVCSKNDDDHAIFPFGRMLDQYRGRACFAVVTLHLVVNPYATGCISGLTKADQ